MFLILPKLVAKLQNSLCRKILLNKKQTFKKSEQLYVLQRQKDKRQILSGYAFLDNHLPVSLSNHVTFIALLTGHATLANLK
jgi:hypothetical protein